MILYHSVVSSMLASLSLILSCQLIGEVIVRGLDLPVPGPVLGLALLLMLLLTRDRLAIVARGPMSDGSIETTGKGLLAHLSLLFVPAGVGVVQELELIAQYGIVIFLILAVSVVLTLLTTVLAFRMVSRLFTRSDDG